MLIDEAVIQVMNAMGVAVLVLHQQQFASAQTELQAPATERGLKLKHLKQVMHTMRAAVLFSVPIVYIPA